MTELISYQQHILHWRTTRSLASLRHRVLIPDSATFKLWAELDKIKARNPGSSAERG